MHRSKTTFAAFLSATVLATAPVALTATAMTLGLAASAEAKGGNGNGNGNGNGGGNRGGGKEKGASQSASAKSKGQGGGATMRQGGGDLFEALGLKKKTVVVRREAPRPAPAAKAPETETLTAEAPAGPGKSWKTRIDGDLVTPASELGPWNSAKRSPVAIANMAEKYRTTGVATGAGGMIGALVVAYEDYNLATGDFGTALDVAVEGGLIDAETANRLIDGSLSDEALAADLAALETLSGGALIVYDEASGSYGCDDAGGGDCTLVSGDDLADLSADRQTLDLIASDPAYADLDAALDGFEGSSMSIEEANALVQPNRSTDPAVQEQMLADVLNLLGLEAVELEPFELEEEEPLPEEAELLPDDGITSEG